ncbi:MAG: phosphoribosylformylglycinamidine synthase subunit PurQ [Gemmatimonadaceae bacterium]|jgi:phosphoribosylformylglycinamidine synthase I|nr:phosphoribosylformylglycinamidine synthase subunit PurQ [Gemmatimonadaceae bacterium]
MSGLKVGVVSFPGSNCDEDAVLAIVEQLHERAVLLWHKDHDLQGADVIILPGGFSYGDYLRSGAIARFSPIMQEVVAHAKRGGPVVGICNGFQIACEAGLLPGALLRNASLQFRSMAVTLKVENTTSVFTNAARAGSLLTMPIAHGDGRYTADDATLDRLEGEGRVAFRYVDATGAATAAANPNGAMRNIAGVTNESGTVVGMMPHPERALEPLLGSTDGLVLFQSLLSAVKA